MRKPKPAEPASRRKPKPEPTIADVLNRLHAIDEQLMSSLQRIMDRLPAEPAASDAAEAADEANQKEASDEGATG
jgi:hypothetical protein